MQDMRNNALIVMEIVSVWNIYENKWCFPYVHILYNNNSAF